MEKAEERVVSNIVKIRTIRNITKRAMADSIGVGEVTMKVEAPDNCVHLEYDESFAMQKIVSGAILCTCVPAPSVSEGVCGADETVRGE